MRVNVKGAIIGVAVGIADEFLEERDATQVPPVTDTFKQWHFWERVGGAVLGYAGQLFGVLPDYAEPLAQSEITLLTKSVVRELKKTETGMTPGGLWARAQRGSVARLTRAPSFSGQVAGNIAARQPEFENVRLYQ